jgi:hypothetical protein
VRLESARELRHKGPPGARTFPPVYRAQRVEALLSQGQAAWLRQHLADAERHGAATVATILFVVVDRRRNESQAPVYIF